MVIYYHHKMQDIAFFLFNLCVFHAPKSSNPTLRRWGYLRLGLRTFSTGTMNCTGRATWKQYQCIALQNRAQYPHYPQKIEGNAVFCAIYR
jgi:hypothetical protein